MARRTILLHVHRPAGPRVSILVWRGLEASRDGGLQEGTGVAHGEDDDGRSMQQRNLSHVRWQWIREQLHTHREQSRSNSCPFVNQEMLRPLLC